MATRGAEAMVVSSHYIKLSVIDSLGRILGRMLQIKK
jgi:hypothetical protein